MPEFETLESEKIPFGPGGTEFFEISLNVLKDGKRETRYWRIARGYVDRDGNERYKKGGVTLPRDKAAIEALAEALKKVDVSKVQGEPSE